MLINDKRRISIAIPTYERVDMTIEAFMEVYGDPRIDDIVIVDDASNLDTFQKLREITDKFEKVRLFRNLNNCDCYVNKMTAISFAKNDWCILLDSDNILDRSYLDVLYEFPYWQEGIFFTPSFAKPLFDFRDYAELAITSENVSEYLDKPMFETMLNAANYFVNKKDYLKAFDANTDPVTSDSIFIAYRHLMNNGIIYCTPKLEYEHRVHSGSHYQTQNHRTPQGFHANILNSLRSLK